MRRRVIGLFGLWWVACQSPRAVPALPVEARGAPTAVLFAIDDSAISALALDPEASSPPSLALTDGARLELRTFSCDRSVLGLANDPVRYGGGGAVLECQREGVPCGLARFRWSPDAESWRDASSDPNIGWPLARPDPEPAIRVYGPVELPVQHAQALLQEQWISAAADGSFLVAFRVIAEGRAIGAQLGRYRFDPSTDPSLRLEDTTFTSTSWIGGRHLPDGSVALISDTGLSGFLDPDTWAIAPGPSFVRDAAVCRTRPGANLERSLRGTVEVWDPGDGSPLVLWAATSCGGVLRRRIDVQTWERLDPGDLRGAHVHLRPYGPDRAFVAGIARDTILSVIGDRSSLESLADDAVDVGYVAPGAAPGSILAGGTRPLTGGTQVYQRVGTGWSPFVEVNLGARAFWGVDDGLLVLTTLLGQPVLFRIPGRPYEERGPVAFEGALASDLRPIGPRSFAVITYPPGGEVGVPGAAVVVTQPRSRCDLAD